MHQVIDFSNIDKNPEHESATLYATVVADGSSSEHWQNHTGFWEAEKCNPFLCMHVDKQAKLLWTYIMVFYNFFLVGSSYEDNKL